MIAAPLATLKPTDDVALDILEGLVRIPSVSGTEQAAAEYLVAQMAALGFEAEIDAAGNAVGVIGTGPEIVLLGHIDTVGGDVPVRVEDGKLHGRGTVDAKGPLATFALAAARAHNAGANGRFVVIGCVEEEAPSSKGAHYAVERYQPVACVIGEPSGWNRVTLGYKGTIRAAARIAQPWTHSAHAGLTAPERLVLWWNAVTAEAERFNAGHERQFDRLLPTLLALASGNDGLTDWATAEVSLRLPPTLSPTAAAALLQAADPTAAVTVLGGVPAFSSPRTDPLARVFTQVFRARGQQPALVLKTGTADMNIVGPAWRCPIVAYGPGDAALDHTPEEHIVLEEYLASIEVLTEVLVRWAGAKL